MSPSEAPESAEPYWAIASFSSATSSALIEMATLRARRSNWTTHASTFSPTEKRSERWPSVAGELVALDEGREVRAGDLHLDAAVERVAMRVKRERPSARSIDSAAITR
jgi:hypothetical protein